VRSATAFRVHRPYSVKREFQCRTNLCSIASTKSNSCYIIKFASFGQCSFSVGPADSKFWRLWRRECVLVLTQQIKKITQIHGAPEEVILFAASNKFMFSFKRWYNQQIRLWNRVLKQELIKIYYMTRNPSMLRRRGSKHADRSVAKKSSISM